MAGKRKAAEASSSRSAPTAPAAQVTYVNAIKTPETLLTDFFAGMRAIAKPPPSDEGSDEGSDADEEADAAREKREKETDAAYLTQLRNVYASARSLHAMASLDSGVPSPLFVFPPTPIATDDGRPLEYNVLALLTSKKIFPKGQLVSSSRFRSRVKSN
jgi:hypothetical protein